jgi:hypothetical protein
LTRARALLFCLPLAVAGCKGSTHREPDEYTGCGNDEQFQTFDDNEAKAVVSDTMAPALVMPTGATVPSSPKPTFSWNQDPNDPGMPNGDVPYGTAPGCNDCCPQFNIGALTTLHEPALSGDVYDLQFTVGGTYAYRVVTTLQEWAAPDAVWQSWRGKTVSLKIYRMSVLVNALKSGPFVASKPATFTISP